MPTPCRKPSTFLLVIVLASSTCGCASNGSFKSMLGGPDDAFSESLGEDKGQANEAGTENLLGSRNFRPVIVVDEPTMQSPVQAGMLCLPTEEVGVFQLWIRIRTHEGFYLHAKDATHNDPNALDVAIDLPSGAKPLGAVDLPTPTIEHEQPVYRGDLVAMGKFKWQGSTPENLMAKVRFQACSDSSCLPPEELELSQTIKP